MNDYQENKTIKFYGRQQILLTVIIDTIITSIYFIFFEKPWKEEFPELSDPTKLTLDIKILFLIVFCIIITIPILFYLTNSKSYIELLDTNIKIKKAKIYPIPKMEIIEIPYEEIESIKIQPTYGSIYSGDFLKHPGGFEGYKLILLKKEENGKNKKIKFYGLDDGNGLNQVLQRIGIKSEFIE